MAALFDMRIFRLFKNSLVLEFSINYRAENLLG